MTSPAPVVLVFLDPAFQAGRLADASQPQLMATDQGATRGDGVFESMLAVGGDARKLQAHLDRLGGSAEALDLVIPAEDAWRAAIATACREYRTPAPGTAPPAEDEVVVKLVATRGAEGADSPTCWVQVLRSGALGRRQRETGIDVILLDRGYDSDVGRTRAVAAARRQDPLLRGQHGRAAARPQAGRGRRHLHFRRRPGPGGPHVHRPAGAPGNVRRRRRRPARSAGSSRPSWTAASSPAPPRARSSPPPRRRAGSSATARWSRRTCWTPTPCG